MPILYPLIMLSALAAGIALSRSRQASLGLSVQQRIAIGLGAFCGGMLGSKLPFALADPNGPICAQAWIGDGKTLLFGLVGGYIGVETAKAMVNVKTKTGDSFAVPLAVAIGIGRLGCFVAGCCHGTPTSLPWGRNFGDGVLRHPTQIYEMVFHFTAAVVLLMLERRQLFQKQRLKLYLLTYCVYRILSEFLRPEIPIAFGLTGYQWAAIVLIPTICWLWWMDASLPNREQFAGPGHHEDHRPTTR